MRSRRLFLRLVLLSPAVLLCGCRSAHVEFNPVEFLFDTVSDTVSEATIHRNETSYERADRQWREARGL
jgi:hypothetical protein